MATAEEAFINMKYVDDEVGIRINPCVEIIAMSTARLIDAPHEGWSNFHKAFRDRFAAEMKWYKLNDDGHFRKMTPAKIDMVPFWFEDKRSREEEVLGVEIKSGDRPDDMGLPAFQFNYTNEVIAPGSLFHMALPLQQGFETLEGMLPLVREAFAEFPLDWGYVGYTVYWDDLDSTFEKDVFDQLMPRVYMRHPGIGLADPTYYNVAGLEGLMGVSWLTLLGPALLEKVGGIAHLRAQLAPPIDVQPLGCQGGGVLIAAGPRPLVGDLAVGDDLPLYKAVGRAVRDARRKRPFYCSGLDEEVSPRWFMRFFGED